MNKQKRIKKIFKPFVKIAATGIVWLILFFQYRLFKSKKNNLWVLLANLCFGDALLFKASPKILKYHITDPDSMPDDLFVWSGQWDEDTIPVEEQEKFVLIKELFIENKDFRDTQFYSFATEQIAKNEPVQRGSLILDSFKNIQCYFERQENTFENIKKAGFNLDIAPQTGVVIDRKGNIIHFRQGHHTLAIARILGIEEVNMRIRAVHSDWLLEQIKCSRFCFIAALKKSFKSIL